MLITEHTIPNTRSTGSGRTLEQAAPNRRSQPTFQWSAFALRALKLLSKAGDRQSWLLLALVMIPVIGMIHNFMTYGFER